MFVAWCLLVVFVVVVVGCWLLVVGWLSLLCIVYCFLCVGVVACVRCWLFVVCCL